MVLSKSPVEDLIQDLIVFDPILNFDPILDRKKFDNATQYTFSYLKEHFPSVTVNEDFSKARISTTDLKKFLDQSNNHIKIMLNECPEGITNMDICSTILLDNKIRVYQNNAVARVLQKSMNSIWGSSILLSAYETVVFSKTLPGNGAGLMGYRPLAFLTVSTLLGVSLSFCETVMPMPFAKRLLSSASWCCLLPAKSTESIFNVLGGAVVSIPVVSKLVSRLRIQDVKLNFTEEILHGEGASISDFKESLKYINAFYHYKDAIKKG